MKHYSNSYQGNILHQNLGDKDKLIVETTYFNNKKNLTKIKLNNIEKFEHVVVFEKV